eukprot:scaffold1399_cov410-Prasinococcus_capsulatus_cf.AAC.41
MGGRQGGAQLCASCCESQHSGNEQVHGPLRRERNVKLRRRSGLGSACRVKRVIKQTNISRSRTSMKPVLVCVRWATWGAGVPCAASPPCGTP